MEIKGRLFDCMLSQKNEFNQDLLNAKVNGAWISYNTHEVHEMIYQLSFALLKMNLSRGDGTTEGRDKIGIISNGRPEWIMVDLAVQLTGAVLVPLYPSTNSKELEQILNEAEVKYIFVSNQELYNKIKDLRTNTPSLIEIFSFDRIDNCVHWTDLLHPLQSNELEELTELSNDISEDDVTTIIYTSGTTGRPKGVMLTHKNILSNVLASGEVLNEIPKAQKRALSFLPLNHIFEKMVTYVYLFYGYSIYYAENMDTIGANMKEVKPYIFTAVPRVLEKVFEKIIIEGKKLTGLKGKIFLWSIKVADQYEIDKSNWWYKIKLAIANNLVYSKWRAAIGGNVNAIVVGSSACPVRLEKIFTAADITIIEGYGLTETSPVIAVNHYQKSKRRFGTVGPILSGIEVRIAEDGEILCKGPNVMVGYYRNKELTEEVMQDGWFHTGDIGIIDQDSFLKITDRKKEIFKTSGGKYVAPLHIENKIKENYFIEQMMVVGAGKKFIAALIVPSYSNLKPWCQKHDISFMSNEQLIKDSRVVAMYQSIIDDYNPEFNRVEQLKKFTLLSQEWTIESGELTPTGKIKRKVITEKHNAEIENMFMDEMNISAKYL